MTGKERLRALAPELAAALLVALLCLYRCRAGLVFAPDSWALWEGSVSLLERGTYAYFSGEPIRYWPPLPSLLLAATQALLGVSCGAVLGFIAGVCGLGWLGWSRLSARLLSAPEAPAHRPVRVAVGLFQASLVLGTGVVLLSHTLLLAFLPWWLCALLDLLDGPEEGRPRARLRLALLGAGLFLSHNTAVVFFPGAALWLAVRRRGAAELARDAAALGASCLVWLVTRLALGQGRSHPLRLGGRHGPVDNLGQLVSGLGERVAPLPAGLAAHAVGVLLLWAALAVVRSPAAEARAARVVTSVGLVALAGLYALFNVVWVADPLNDRFVWFFPLLAVPAAAALLARRSARAALALVLLASAASLTQWLIATQRDWRQLRSDLVPRAAWISTRPPDPADPRAADRTQPAPQPLGTGSAVEDMLLADELERQEAEGKKPR